ncbi:hypothetical protein SALBM135S_03707 [Streptomyces alboniger]
MGNSPDQITSYTYLGDAGWRQLSTGGASDKKTWLNYYYEQGTKRINRALVGVEGASAESYDAKYTYDVGGNVLSIVDDPTGGTRDTQCFRHDSLRRTTDDLDVLPGPGRRGRHGHGGRGLRGGPVGEHGRRRRALLAQL